MERALQELEPKENENVVKNFISTANQWKSVVITYSKHNIII